MGRGRLASVIQAAGRRPVPVAAQSRRSAWINAAAVPVADGGADDRPEEIGQASGTAGIYGITLCKTENFQGVFSTGKTVLPRFCGAVYPAVKRTGKGSGTPLFFF